MSDAPEKKDPKVGGFVDSMKKKFTSKEEKPEETEEEKSKPVKMEQPSKPLEPPRKAALDQPPSPTTAKMVSPEGVELAAVNPNMHRKHVTVLSQKPSGARKYFRSK